MPKDEVPVRRQWRWYFTPGHADSKIAFEEFKGLPQAAQVELFAAIRRRERGLSLPGEVRSLGRDLCELKVAVGRVRYRALYFVDSPVHDVCVLAVLKNQPRLDGHVEELARTRMAEWRAKGRAKRTDS
jgi:hypothetical protein